MKDNRKLREKIVQSIQLLFSLDLYREILDDNERQEEELAQAVSHRIYTKARFSLLLCYRRVKSFLFNELAVTKPVTKPVTRFCYVLPSR